MIEAYHMFTHGVRMILLWQMSRFEAAHYALSCLFEATNQLRIDHVSLATHLIDAAAGALHQPIPIPTYSSIAYLQNIALDDMTPHWYDHSGLGMALTWLLAISIILTLYFYRERALSRITREQDLLRDKLLAISSGWMLATVKPGSAKEVISNIVTQLTKYTEIEAVEIFHADDTDHSTALHQYCSSGQPLLWDHGSIPHALLQVHAGAVREVMQSHKPWFSGSYGAVGAILPGVRLQNVAVYPLIDRDRIWGLMVVKGKDAHFFSRLEDLMAIIAKEIAILLAYGAMESVAAKIARFQEMDQLRTELLANVSHELRTPLGLVRGYAETLLYRGERLTKEQMIEYVTVIGEESAQLELQIDKLLKMSTFENGQSAMRYVYFLVKDWVLRIRLRLLANVRVSLYVEDHKEWQVYGDPDELLDAVSNLLDNALKYSTGSVELYITRVDSALRVSVVDGGIGVPEDELTMIFERFYRSERHAKSEKRGSGLGLSLVKVMIEAHHGTVFAHHHVQGFEVGFVIPSV